MQGAEVWARLTCLPEGSTARRQDLGPHARPREEAGGRLGLSAVQPRGGGRAGREDPGPLRSGCGRAAAPGSHAHGLSLSASCPGARPAPRPRVCVCPCVRARVPAPPPLPPAGADPGPPCPRAPSGLFLYLPVSLPSLCPSSDLDRDFWNNNESAVQQKWSSYPPKEFILNISPYAPYGDPRLSLK